MKSVWYAGLNAQEKQEIEADFRASANLRKRLTTLLRKKIDSKWDSVRTKDSYDISNWSLLQADTIGYEKALLEVMNLIENEEKEK